MLGLIGPDGGAIHEMRVVLEVSETNVVIACRGCAFYRLSAVSTALQDFVAHVPGGVPVIERPAMPDVVPLPPPPAPKVSRRRGIGQPREGPPRRAKPPRAVKPPRKPKEPRVAKEPRVKVLRVKAPPGKGGVTPRTPTAEQVLLVGRIYDIIGATLSMTGPELAVSRSVVPAIGLPRQLAAALAVHVTGASYQQVGMLVQASDSAVHAAVTRMPGLLATSSELRSLAATVARLVGISLPETWPPCVSDGALLSSADLRSQLRERIVQVYGAVSQLTQIPVTDLRNHGRYNTDQFRWLTLALAYYAVRAQSLRSFADLDEGVTHKTVGVALRRGPELLREHELYRRVTAVIAAQLQIALPDEWLAMM